MFAGCVCVCVCVCVMQARVVCARVVCMRGYVQVAPAFVCGEFNFLF